MKATKHLLFILVVITIALFIALGIRYYDSLQHIWLWLIGFAGAIVELFRRTGSKISSYFITDTIPPVSSVQKMETPIKPNLTVFPEPVTLPVENKPGEKTTNIKVLRYNDDGETTLGLLYIDDKFYCYTLEDTFREVKVQGKTRIPAGSYTLDFLKQLTPLTLTYRKTRDWFDYHLEIKNVPDFTGVYVHNGGTSADTEGCLLIANGISAIDTAKTLSNSRQTFEEFYKLIGNSLRNNYAVNINIYNENWIDQLK